MTDAYPDDGGPVLLICTVGGTPEAVTRSLLHWTPARVLFLATDRTRPKVDAALMAYDEQGGVPIPPGAREVYPVSDEEDFCACVREMRESLEGEVTRWLGRGKGYRVVVDITGGTKCMSSALALVARRWACQFSYVGGSSRTKGGVGVVESGAERVQHSANPWDALGYQVVEDAVLVFNHGGLTAAASLVDAALRKAGDPAVRRELGTLKCLMEGYAAWDRFEHKKALDRLRDAAKNRDDFRAIFPACWEGVVRRLDRHCECLERLAGLNDASVTWIVDLLENARRRASERRYDDAVARLYRVLEALAQVQLRDRYGLPQTSAVPLDRIPEPLRTRWASRAENGAVAIGLQDDYALLEALGDPLGRAFADAGLADREKSPLAARNQSILAHGFQPVSEAVYGQLHERVTALVRGEAPGVSIAEPDDWHLPLSSGSAGCPATLSEVTYPGVRGQRSAGLWAVWCGETCSSQEESRNERELG